jgi:holo-[acyl-carrier protein] synthase
MASGGLTRLPTGDHALSGYRPNRLESHRSAIGRGQLRVGTDLCSVADVADSIERFGDRYLRRVYTEHELAYCLAAPGRAPERLAARFAAKEAAIKVLRPAGWWPDWRSIEVRRDPDGWCELNLTGRAAAHAAEQGVLQLVVSLTHDGGVAAAVVVAEVSDNDGRAA